MDAAAAARMSDPERNPNFRRRWVADALDLKLAPPRIHVDRRRRPDMQGRDLLAAWRRERAVATGCGQ